MGASSSTAEATVEVNQDLVQQFAGTCDFKCDNSISNVAVDIVNTRLEGGLKITQQCSADATCSVTTNMDSIVDTIAKASGSSNAKDAGFGRVDVSKGISKVRISDYVQQKVYDSCKVSSTNDIRNIQIFAANSEIDGGILIGQVGTTRGNCTFDTVMNAVENATGNSNANSTSGKDKKGEKCGSCSSLQMIAIYAGVGIAVIFALGILAFVIKSFASKGSSSSTSTTSSSGISTVKTGGSLFSRLVSSVKPSASAGLTSALETAAVV